MQKLTMIMTSQIVQNADYTSTMTCVDITWPASYAILLSLFYFSFNCVPDFFSFTWYVVYFCLWPANVPVYWLSIYIVNNKWKVSIYCIMYYEMVLFLLDRLSKEAWEYLIRIKYLSWKKYAYMVVLSYYYSIQCKSVYVAHLMRPTHTLFYTYCCLFTSSRHRQKKYMHFNYNYIWKWKPNTKHALMLMIFHPRVLFRLNSSFCHDNQIAEIDYWYRVILSTNIWHMRYHETHCCIA